MVANEKRIAVYKAYRNCLGAPDGYITKAEKYALLDSGEAVSIHRGKAIHLIPAADSRNLIFEIANRAISNRPLRGGLANGD